MYGLREFRDVFDRELSFFDAVILVHYDYFEAYPPKSYDKFVMYDAWKVMHEQALWHNKQVFAVGMSEKKNSLVLEHDFYFISPRKTIEERVKEIVEAVHKTGRDISLLFGGVMSADCVYTHLTGMCSCCDSADIYPLDDEVYLDFASRTKIGYGKLEPLLTERVLTL